MELYAIRRRSGWNVYEASSPAKIREHAERVGMPATEISSIVDTVVVRPDPLPAAA